MICYLLGVRGIIGLALVSFYCICAVARLAFFNVLEGKRQQIEGGCNKTYRGLPVTSIAFILPLLFWLQFLMPDHIFMILLHIILFVVGFLFILDFTLPKPDLKTIITMICVVGVTVAVIFGYTKFRVPKLTDVPVLIVDEIADKIAEDMNDADQP